MKPALDEWLEDTAELIERVKESERIQEAVKHGHAKTPDYERDPAPGYDGHLRDLVAMVVIGRWNEKRTFSTLAEIYQGVREKIAREQEDSTWPKIWLTPSKRTVDRRTNECARPEFYPESPPPLVCVRAGRYIANPVLFEESVKEEITK